MKTRLLKKIRDKHPIYFDSVNNVYQYKTVNGKLCSGDIWECDYKSEWIKDYKTILGLRRELILNDSRFYFFNTWLCYKRKRRLKTYRVF